jgi:hypothetical protein
LVVVMIVMGEGLDEGEREGMGPKGESEEPVGKQHDL